MQIARTDHFKSEFKKLPTPIQKQAIVNLEKFINNQSHPSLHVKKLQGMKNRWEFRITKSYRVTWQKIKDGILLRHIGTHDILRKER